MFQRIMRVATLVGLVSIFAGSQPADAKYRYGKYSGGRGGGGGESGVFLFFDASLTNPRNTDAVLATIDQIQDFGGGTNVQFPVIPIWDDEFAGRVGIGYGWSNGNRLSLSFWGYSGDQTAAGNGPSGSTTYFHVGPPIFTGGDFIGDSGSPGFFDLTTEVDATLVDLAWARTQELADSFWMEWSLGLRYANYEETTAGDYDELNSTDAAFGQNSFAAAKSNEGDMIGARVAVHASYELSSHWSVGGGVGFSFLDGELTSSASMNPTGTVNSVAAPSSFASVVDDSRSGTIRDVDLGVTWRSTGDTFRLSFGWEQSLWEAIAADLVRNFPGTAAPLQPRDSVTFSGYKLGVYYRF